MRRVFSQSSRSRGALPGLFPETLHKHPHQGRCIQLWGAHGLRDRIRQSLCVLSISACMPLAYNPHEVRSKLGCEPPPAALARRCKKDKGWHTCVGSKEHTYQATEQVAEKIQPWRSRVGRLLSAISEHSVRTARGWRITTCHG